MPSLADYIGGLVAEAANARAQADREATRLAEAYNADPLLRHFSVPRFRLPTIKVSLPVAIEQAPRSAPPPTVEQAKAAVQKAVERQLASRGTPLTGPELAAVSKRLDEAAKRMAEDPRSRMSEFELADALAAAAVEALPARMREAPPAARAGRAGRMPPTEGPPTPGPRPTPGPPTPGPPTPGPVVQGALDVELRDAARLAVIAIRAALPDLQVKATSAELAGVDPNTIVRVELTLSEQGLEWSGEEAQRRLTPE